MLTRAVSRAMSSSSSGPLFLGLDASTQGLKATLVDSSLRPVPLKGGASVNYLADVPGAWPAGAREPVLKDARGGAAQPTSVFFAALDAALAKLAAAAPPGALARVAAVSGSGQQHGSVFWGAGGRAALRGLAAGKGDLAAQLAPALSRAHSPIWMDSASGAQCRALEAAVGGPAKLAALTGSRAYERFTGNVLARVAKEEPAAWAATERVSLISSAMASVLLGDFAPIDVSDGSGMNLLDITGGSSGAWSAPVLAALAPSAPGLAAKLGGNAVASHSVLGTLAPYFVQRYGFSPACEVVAWSGDNPCSVAGLGVRAAGDVAVSLGTSDTIFGLLAAATPGVDGHVFVNPVDPAGFMAMLCYKNGSLTRERVRDAAAGGAWPAFGAALLGGAPGNGGRLGFFLDAAEITPTTPAAGDFRFEASAGAGGGGVRAVAAFPSPADDVRAAVQTKFLSMRAHSAAVGLAPVRRIIATGGASANAAILQTLADVFGAPVYTTSQPDSASLGAAYRAAHAHACSRARAFVSFADVLDHGLPGNAGRAGAERLALAAQPRAAEAAAFTKLLPAVKAAEAAMLAAMAK